MSQERLTDRNQLTAETASENLRFYVVDKNKTEEHPDGDSFQISREDLIELLGLSTPSTTPGTQKITFGIEAINNTEGQSTTVNEMIAAMNSVGFTITPGYVAILEVQVLQVINGAQWRVFKRYRFKNNNVSGTWGTGSTNGKINYNHLIELAWRQFIKIEANSEYNDLGDIGSSTIEDHLNGLPANTYVLTNLATDYYFTCIRNGTEQVYQVKPLSLPLTISNDTVTSADFDLVASSDTPPVNGGGSSVPVSKTGTTMVFTEDAFYNEIAYLTSGNLTLDLTDAVKGVGVVVYCDRYTPTISGEDFLITGSFDNTKLNQLIFVWDGTIINLIVIQKTYLATPLVTLTPNNTQLTVSGFSVPNATSYEILFSTTNDIGTASAVPSYDGTSTSYVHTGLTNGVTYYYWVKAINKSGYLDSAYGTASGEPADIIFRFTVIAPDSTFVLPLVSTGTYNFVYRVDGGAWSVPVTVYNQSEATIALGDTASHLIEIDGIITGIRFENNAQASKMRVISNWGNIKLGLGSTALENVFWGCTAMTITATDIPDLNTTTIKQWFKNCDGLTTVPNMGNWDVSAVTDFSYCFQDTSSFNANIDDWDVSNGINFSFMFQNADGFTGALADWDVSNGTNFESMFRLGANNNPDVTNWDMSNATNCQFMLASIGSFNRDLSSWNVENLTGATALNNFLLSETLSTTNYDALLIAWSAQSLNSGITAHFGDSKYTPGGAAEAARLVLTGTYGWTITDGGPV